MLLPAQIIVGPFKFSVVADHAAIHAIDDCNGATSKEHCRISIDDARAPDAVAETLLHETLHACFAVVANRQNKLTEHDFIYMLAPTLLDVLRRNPLLVGYLVNG